MDNNEDEYVSPKGCAIMILAFFIGLAILAIAMGYAESLIAGSN